MLRKRISTAKDDSRSIELKAVILATLSSTEHFLHILFTLFAKHNYRFPPLTLIC